MAIHVTHNFSLVVPNHIKLRERPFRWCVTIKSLVFARFVSKYHGLQMYIEKWKLWPVPNLRFEHTMYLRNGTFKLSEKPSSAMYLLSTTLAGDAARYLMLKSNLPKPQLYHIWSVHQYTLLDYTLTLQFFTIASISMKLLVYKVNFDTTTITYI